MYSWQHFIYLLYATNEIFMQLNTTEELIEDMRHGKMVILMDDEDRENEGDLIMVAVCASAPPAVGWTPPWPAPPTTAGPRAGASSCAAAR